MPVIDAPPTEYSTIDTILVRSKEIADKLELKYAVLVFDEAVYAKVQQVRWKEEAFINWFVVRLGEFHTIMTYLFAVSKIFEDGGLKVISFYFLSFRSENIAYEQCLYVRLVKLELQYKSHCEIRYI